VTTLAEFILARIAEDEAAVPASHLEDDWSTGYDMDAEMMLVRVDRWLAECAAKRRLVELHSRAHHCDDEATGGTGWVWEFETCPTLRLLALPYASHPDYQAEEWAI
jgi:hypothetical protein